MAGIQHIFTELMDKWLNKEDPKMVYDIIIEKMHIYIYNYLKKKFMKLKKNLQTTYNMF